MNRKSSKKKIKKEVSNKKKSTKQNMNSSSKTKTLKGEKKIKSIYSKVMTGEKSKNKNSKDKGQERYFNKNDNNNSKKIIVLEYVKPIKIVHFIFIQLIQ
jgi:hypothetical protein